MTARPPVSGFAEKLGAELRARRAERRARVAELERFRPRPPRDWAKWAQRGLGAMLGLVLLVLLIAVLCMAPACGGRYPVGELEPDAGADALPSACDPMPTKCLASACAYCAAHILAGRSVPVLICGGAWCAPDSTSPELLDCSSCVGGDR